MPLQFSYNRRDFSIVELVNGVRANYWIITPFTTNLPNQNLNTQLNIVSELSGDGTSYQETYTFNVSDNKNKTIGSIQYIMNYKQANNGAITSIPFLDTRVLSANGVFRQYQNAKVHQTFDNVTGNRSITITKSCGC
jgi:hypothetical protein